ncbi:MAG: pentapeptide repeat-containing protein [Aggregatilineales bacterium]
MTEATLTRDEEIRQIHREYTTFYQLGGGLLLVVIGVLIGALIFADDSGYGTNIYTEILSVGLTIGVLNVLQERRDTRNRIKDLQEQLVREAGSPAYAIAITAVDTMRKRGWLGRKNMIIPDDTESLLENANLFRVDLQNVNLEGSNLTNVNLYRANLTGTNLAGANLTNAILWKENLTRTILEGANLTSADLRSTDLTSANLLQANLTRANLYRANLSNAYLERTDLTSANLESANLIDTHLVEANLTGANLHRANLTGSDLTETNLSSANLRKADLSDALIQKSTMLDENTILPDGSNWSKERDLAEFGAETREIISQEPKVVLLGGTVIYTFADGTKRRWQRFNGWLDDRDGNPIADNT